MILLMGRKIILRNAASRPRKKTRNTLYRKTQKRTKSY